jgi:hypothetical protein
MFNENLSVVFPPVSRRFHYYSLRPKIYGTEEFKLKKQQHEEMTSIPLILHYQPTLYLPNILIHSRTLYFCTKFEPFRSLYTGTEGVSTSTCSTCSPHARPRVQGRYERSRGSLVLEFSMRQKETS